MKAEEVIAQIEQIIRAYRESQTNSQKVYKSRKYRREYYGENLQYWHMVPIN